MPTRFLPCLVAFLLALSNSCSSDVTAGPSLAETRSNVCVTLESRGLHASGISYRYPGDGQLDPRGDGLLIPDDAPRDAQGANELYLVLGVPYDARVRADDADALAALLFGDGHAFEPDGSAEDLEPGLLFRYRSTGAHGELAAHSYVRVEGGLARCLVGIGLRDAIDARAPLARAVFESFDYEAPERDARLVGSWTRGESYTNSFAEFSMAVEWRMRLAADGTFVKSSTAAGGDASSGASSDGDSTYGTWRADDETLTLVAADGSTQTFTYELVNGALVTHDEAGRRTIWE